MTRCSIQWCTFDCPKWSFRGKDLKSNSTTQAIRQLELGPDLRKFQLSCPDMHNACVTESTGNDVSLHHDDHNDKNLFNCAHWLFSVAEWEEVVTQSKRTQ